MLEESATSCPYCGTPSAQGLALQQQYAAEQRQAEQNEKAARSRKAEEEVGKQALVGLIATIVGFFICCAPVSLAGLVLSLRAKTTARHYGIIAPATSTIGVVLGLCATLFTLGFYVNVYLNPSSERDSKSSPSSASASSPSEAESPPAEGVKPSVPRPSDSVLVPSTGRPRETGRDAGTFRRR